jgi:hypothetical protein
MSSIVTERLANELIPPFAKYSGMESYFEGNTPLSKAVGYIVVLGFGAVFSVFTTAIVFFDKKFKGNANMTSEHFNSKFPCIGRPLIRMTAMVVTAAGGKEVRTEQSCHGTMI